MPNNHCDSASEESVITLLLQLLSSALMTRTHSWWISLFPAQWIISWFGLQWSVKMTIQDGKWQEDRKYSHALSGRRNKSCVKESYRSPPHSGVTPSRYHCSFLRLRTRERCIAQESPKVIAGKVTAKLSPTLAVLPKRTEYNLHFIEWN